MKDIMKIVKYLEEWSLLKKGVKEKIEAKKQKGWISWHFINYIKCTFIEKYVNR